MLNWIAEHWDEVLAVYGGLVAFSTAVVQLTPSTKDDEWLGKIVKVLDFFSTAFTKADKEKLEK